MIPTSLLTALAHKTRTVNGFNYVLDAEGMYIVKLIQVEGGEKVIVGDDDGRRGSVTFMDDGRRV